MLQNFFHLYLPIVDEWTLLDNSAGDAEEVIAWQANPGSSEVVDQAKWDEIREKYV